jgi:hypothetical protein
MKTKNEIVEQIIKDYEKEFKCHLFGQEPLLERAVKTTKLAMLREVQDDMVKISIDNSTIERRWLLLSDKLLAKIKEVE